MTVEKQMECRLAGETQVLRENLVPTLTVVTIVSNRQKNNIQASLVLALPEIILLFMNAILTENSYRHSEELEF
jgi:hypothetical protein